MSDFLSLHADTVTLDNPAYESSRQEWNRAIQKYPRAIAYCGSATDVRQAVKWAAKCHVPVRIRSGGHHYEGYSTGNNVLVLDVSRMNGIAVHPGENLIRVESGVTNRQLYQAVTSLGYPFPGGTCPTVAVCGYTLSGGWGLSARQLGLGCDSLVSVEIVNDKGEFVTANTHCNQDLFWALRGAGGGNFGVAAALTFRLPEKTGKVTLIGLEYANSPPEAQAAAFAAWQRMLPALPEELTMQMSFYYEEDKPGIYGRGLYYGAPAEAAALLQPLLNVGVGATLRYLTFGEAMQAVMEGYPPYEKFKSTGRFVYRDYDMAEIRELLELLKVRPRGSVYRAITLYALGGRVTDVKNTDTAYYYRDARYILGIQSVWEDDAAAAANIEWVDQRFRVLKCVTHGSYINFPYSGLEDYENAYYGQNACRLTAVKRRYDPRDFFRFPQSIRP